MESKQMLELVEKLNSVSTSAAEALIKQAHIHAMFSGVFAVLIVAAIIACVYAAYTSNKELKYSEFDGLTKIDLEMKRAFASLGACVLLIFLLVLCYIDIYTPLVNPQFWALKQIIK